MYRFIKYSSLQSWSGLLTFSGPIKQPSSLKTSMSEMMFNLTLMSRMAFYEYLSHIFAYLLMVFKNKGTNRHIHVSKVACHYGTRMVQRVLLTAISRKSVFCPCHVSGRGRLHLSQRKHGVPWYCVRGRYENFSTTIW